MLRWLLVLTCLALGACSVGGGSQPTAPVDPAPLATSVSGVAATGAGIVGRIYLKDPTGTERYVDTTDGSFTIPSTGLTPPFLLKATWLAGGQPQTAYSISATGGTTNITPLTQLIVLNAAGVDSLDALYANLSVNGFTSIVNALPAATASVQSMLAPLFTRFGVTGVDPISGPLVANHQGMDALLDHITVTYAGGTVTIADAVTGAPLVVAPAHDIVHALAGADWTADDAAVASDPSIAVDANGNTVVVWWQVVGNRSVVRARFLSGDGAAPTTLNPSGDGGAPKVVFDGSGNAIAVWTQWQNNRSDIWARRYVAANAAWDPALRVSAANALDSAYVPDVAVDAAGNAIVTWYQGDTRPNHFDGWAAAYVASTDAWGAAQMISDGFNSTYDVRVALNAAGNGLVAWQQEQGDGTMVSNGPRDIWSRTVTTGGNWGTPSRINAVAGNVQVIYGQVAVGVDPNGNGAVLWVQAAPSMFGVHAAHYAAASGWQSSAVITSQLVDNCYGPRFGFDAAGNALAVWQQQTGSGAYTAASRFVAGAGWGTSASITDTPGDTFDPQVAVDPAGNATAIWAQFENTGVSVRTARYFTGAGWAGSSLLAATQTDGYLTAPVPRVAAGSGGKTAAIWGINGY